MTDRDSASGQSSREVGEPRPVATSQGRGVRAAHGLTRVELDELASASKYGLVGWWARFWAEVEEVDGHWLWRGAQSGDYGFVVFGAEGKTRRLLAHRVAFVYVHGDLAEGEDALHLPGCRHKNCLKCLRRGTQAENNADMDIDGTRARGDAAGSSKAARDRARTMAAEFDAEPRLTCAALARRHHVTLPTVYRAVRKFATRKPVKSDWWKRASL